MEMGSLEAVVGAFSAQAAELREATLLRVDDGTRALYARDLEAIEGTVRALEGRLREVKDFLRQEKEAIPYAEAALEAMRLQQQHLRHIAAHLPTYLPSLPEAAAAAGAGGALQELSANQQQEARAQVKRKPQQPAAAPRRYISQEELESQSSYMRGRLTRDRINAALDEMAGRAEGNAALVLAARRNKPLGADKRHAVWLLYNIECADALRGRPWVLEADLKAGAALRLDKSGKAMLTLLRHLGRLAEVRVSVEGTTHLAYVLL